MPADPLSPFHAPVREWFRAALGAPTRAQAMGWPSIARGESTLLLAPTGSGKTLAFAVPLAATVEHCAPKKPQGLILAPTRELAQQIADVLAPLLATRGRKVGAVYGGIGYERQRKDLRRGVDVVVACPGRLEDLMQEGTIRLSEVRTVIIDEADRMADMGFLPAVRRILDTTPSSRQTLLFSATLDGGRQGDGEGQRLAGPGRSLGADVASGQGIVDGHGLDGHGGRDALCGQGLHDAAGQRQVGERGHVSAQGEGGQGGTPFCGHAPQPQDRNPPVACGAHCTTGRVGLTLPVGSGPPTSSRWSAPLAQQRVLAHAHRLEVLS